MLRNMSVSEASTAMLKELVPLFNRKPDNQLWAVYDQFQQWKLSVEWQYPGISDDKSPEMAKSLLKALEQVSNRELAQTLKRVILRHTPPAKPMNPDNSTVPMQQAYVYIVPSSPASARQALH